MATVTNPTTSQKMATTATYAVGSFEIELDGGGLQNLVNFLNAQASLGFLPQNGSETGEQAFCVSQRGAETWVTVQLVGGAPVPVGSVSITNVVEASTALVLSAAGAASAGGSAIYTGTITGGGGDALAGEFFQVVGFTKSVNNGYFECTGSSTTTLTLSNANAQAETHAGTATNFILTITAAAIPDGGPVFLANLGHATFLDGQTVVALTSSGTTFTANDPTKHGTYGTQAETQGTATFMSAFHAKRFEIQHNGTGLASYVSYLNTLLRGTAGLYHTFCYANERGAFLVPLVANDMSGMAFPFTQFQQFPLFAASQFEVGEAGAGLGALADYLQTQQTNTSSYTVELRSYVWNTLTFIVALVSND